MKDLRIWYDNENDKRILAIQTEIHSNNRPIHSEEWRKII